MRNLAVIFRAGNWNSGFNNRGNNGYFWSSAENNGSNAWNRNLNYNNAGWNWNNNNKTNGFSVRCVKDLHFNEKRRKKITCRFVSGIF